MGGTRPSTIQLYKFPTLRRRTRAGSKQWLRFTSWPLIGAWTAWFWGGPWNWVKVLAFITMTAWIRKLFQVLVTLSLFFWFQEIKHITKPIFSSPALTNDMNWLHSLFDSIRVVLVNNNNSVPANYSFIPYGHIYIYTYMIILINMYKQPHY